MGSPDFCQPALDYLGQNSTWNLCHIITQPPAPKGRSKTPVPTAVQSWAEAHHVDFSCPTSNDELTKIVETMDPDLIIVIAYGRFIPQKITSTYSCINVHASLLPKHRGASPIQSSMLAGDSQTGVTLMKINEKMDSGDIISSLSMPLNLDLNFEDVHNRLAELSREIIQDLLSNTSDFSNITSTPQDDHQATYCQKITTADRELTPGSPAIDQLRKINAFSPKPGAFISVNNQPIKIIKAHLENDQLHIDIIQPPGKKPMSYHDYCLGNPQGISLC